MTMMLLAIFAAAGVGTFAREFGRREVALCISFAVALAAIYFIRPASMT